MQRKKIKKLTMLANKEDVPANSLNKAVREFLNDLKELHISKGYKSLRPWLMAELGYVTKQKELDGDRVCHKIEELNIEGITPLLNKKSIMKRGVPDSFIEKLIKKYGRKTGCFRERSEKIDNLRKMMNSDGPSYFRSIVEQLFKEKDSCYLYLNNAGTLEISFICIFWTVIYIYSSEYKKIEDIEAHIKKKYLKTYPDLLTPFFNGMLLAECHYYNDSEDCLYLPYETVASFYKALSNDAFVLKRLRDINILDYIKYIEYESTKTPFSVNHPSVKIKKQTEFYYDVCLKDGTKFSFFS